jgi:signal transduction histidine kinase
LQKTILTQEDLPKNAAGQTIASQLHYAPTVFTWLKRAPYILGALLLFLVIDFILLSPRRRKGIKNLSTILISSGVSIIIFPILFSYVIPYFSKSFQFDFESVGTQKIFSEIIDQLSRNIDILFIAIGGAIALLGLVLYVGERITRPTTKYTNLEKRSGLAVSTKKQEQSPKSLRGKLNQDNIPLQTSDGPKNKKQKGKSKYRTIMNKKEF